MPFLFSMMYSCLYFCFQNIITDWILVLNLCMDFNSVISKHGLIGLGFNSIVPKHNLLGS